MKFVIGLGNPGRKYVYTRHNVGFRVLDNLAKLNNHRFKKDKFYEYSVYDNRVVLLKPLTYMNRSGEAVLKGLEQRKIDLESITIDNLLVVYDDLYIPLGDVRIRKKGADGGHNGIASVIQALSSQSFPRLKIGIGPEVGIEDNQINTNLFLRENTYSNYVLSNFSTQEEKILDNVIEFSTLLINSFINYDYETMINYYSKNK